MRNSLTRGLRGLVAAAGFGALLLTPACHRSRSKERQAVRAELSRAMRAQDYAGAAASARHALEITPHDNGIWDRLMQTQFALDDLQGAKRVLATWRATADRPSPKMDEYSGDIAIREHDLSAAQQSWTKALREMPKNERILEKIARAFATEGKGDDEYAAWTRAITIHDSATARVNRALCLRRLHRWQEAQADLERGQALGHDEPEVVRASKLFAGLSRALPEIRELDARLALAPHDASLLSDRAALFLRCADPDLALLDCDAAIKAQPTAMRPRLFQIIALGEKSRTGIAPGVGTRRVPRLENFLPEFLQTLSRLDSDISAETDNAELYVNRAWQLNDVLQPELALDDAQRALQLDAKSAGALVESSYAWMKLGRGDEAFAAIKQATELDPHFSTAWQYRGELEMQRREFTNAVDSLSRALAISQMAAALEKREQCYRELGLLVKAEDDHRAIAELNARGLK